MNASNKVTTRECTRPPGLADLLINGTNLENPERAVQATQIALLPVRCGIHAIGALLVDAAAADEPVASETLSDAGFLLEFLADIQGALGHIMDCATNDLIQAAREGEE